MAVELSPDIDRCLQARESHFCLRPWLCVPALTPPFNHGKVQWRLLPSIAECSVTEREDLEGAVGILSHHRLRKIAIPWFGKLVSGFAEALPVAPAGVWQELPCVPESAINH